MVYSVEKWLAYREAEDAGYSAELLGKACGYARDLGAAAIMVVHDGNVLYSWGEVTRRFLCHSIRKSFMSALVGIHEAEGGIDLSKTIASLGLDDDPPLTDEEKRARIVDLLNSRSGVFHKAAFEHSGGDKYRPERGSAAPGERWYYSNWDFNVLHAIFEQETGVDFFTEFRRRIAQPIGMEDYRDMDTYLVLEAGRSRYPAYGFRMSSRDMARFGLLYLRRGQWGARQIIPEVWVERTTKFYSYCNPDDPGAGHNYLWWTLGPEPYPSLHEAGTYEARGLSSHKLVVMPGADLVVVFRCDTYAPNPPFMLTQQWYPFLEMLLAAQIAPPKPAAERELIPWSVEQEACVSVPFDTGTLGSFVGHYEVQELGGEISIEMSGERLIVHTIPQTCPPTYLCPVSATEFVLEDVGAVISFDADQDKCGYGVTYAPPSGKRTPPEPADARDG